MNLTCRQSVLAGRAESSSQLHRVLRSPLHFRFSAKVQTVSRSSRLGYKKHHLDSRIKSSEEKESAVSIEEDFSALSDEVEKLAANCLPKLDGVSIFLVGMMGSGKSTVGKLLAKTLDYCFFDTDDLIEQLTQKDIPSIFAEDGESSFREIETQVLSELGAYKTCVVATGGGAVVEQKNWAYLQNGVVIYLQGATDLLARRVHSDGTEGRPLLNGTDAEVSATMDRINSILEARASKYAQSDITVPLEGTGQDSETGAPPAVVVHRILTELLIKLDEKIAIDDQAARKEFEIQDNGPKPLYGPPLNQDKQD